jgi:homeobox-leucine zipper protein
LSSGGQVRERELDVNRFPAMTEEADDGASLSSPSSSVSPFPMDFSMRNNNAEYGGRNKRENEGEAERVSDDDENGSTRKKLRLSKDQSAFLEESFKEHTTLNPVNFSYLFFLSFFFN